MTQLLSIIDGPKPCQGGTFTLLLVRRRRRTVHFHCWNLYISNSTIGFKGISVTGGGNLIVENTEQHGNTFLNFRRDYGAKWDGDIRIIGCRLRPVSNGPVSIIYQQMMDFNYQYPIGHGRTIKIQDFTVDYRAAPNSTATCWLINTVNFSKIASGARLFFPHSAEFRNINVVGREKGIRLFELPAPGDLHVERTGSYNGVQLRANSQWIFDNIQLEELPPDKPDDATNSHLRLGGASEIKYADEHALYPKIEFSNCDHLNLFLGHCIASVFFDKCGVNTVFAPGLRGALSFADCHVQPDVKEAADPLWTVDSELGTRFTNCTLHAPKIAGKSALAEIGKIGFITINKSLKHYHLNTALGNDLLNHFRQTKITLTSEFISKLKAHHALEE